ncbi:ATP-binding protein [Streptomyces luteolus]|uniref:Regulator n=1 Tax=Streptomyces luteolus TaxID=3043615 RepID=A0ABT6SRI7_9ACTN|nr:regulator [Streptomyces sp. B-S-A12]MDI3418221.1 regulator [Streptomyces sp. B-S-A12]
MTLTGVGGVGKSRLARQRIGEGLPPDVGTVCWADLWPLQGEDLLAAVVADACGLSDHTPRMPLEVLSSWIGARPVLLVLDSCEHLLDACRRLVAALLTACPRLTVLVTSREPLHLDGERVIRVDPLPGATDAVELFTYRAAEAGHPLANGEATERVRELCEHLDGLPLALELAAGQLGHSTLEETLMRPRLGLDRQDSGVRPVVPRRHDALRTALGWSHELCTPAERLLWARLSVVRGHFDAGTAAAVCAGGPLTVADVYRALDGLVDKSVVVHDRGRHRVLDTVREYGRLWLEELGEVDRAADRHAAHFLELVRSADAAWAGPEQAAWYRTIREPYPDLCAAADHLLEHRPDEALELTALVGFFWMCCGHLHEAQRYVERALSASTLGGPMRVHGLWALGLTHILQGDYAAGHGLASACLSEARLAGDEAGLLRAGYLHGLSNLLEGRAAAALDLVDEALPRAGAPVGGRASGPALMCRLVRVFGLTASGLLQQARREAQLLRETCVTDGEHWTRSYADYQLCVIALSEGDADAAVRHARSMLASKQQIGDSFGIALGLDMLSAAFAAAGDGEGSALAYGTGDRFWQVVGHPQRGTPEVAPLRDEGERTARALLGDQAYDDAFQEGAHADPASMLRWAVGSGY